jgi:hypothetical protein
MTWWIIIALLALLLITALWFTGFFSMPLRDELEKFVSKMHPAVRDKFRRFIREIESKGHRVDIASCWRGWPDSLRIWQTYPEVQGCCQPGRDYHYMGMACDLVIHTKDGKRLGNNSSRADWESSGIPQLAQSKYGLQWGGMQGFSYWDPVHFAWVKYPMNELVARVEETCGSLQGDCGNKISLLGLNPRV